LGTPRVIVAGRRAFFGGMTSYRVAVRYHRFWRLELRTRHQKISQKREYYMNKKQYKNK